MLLRPERTEQYFGGGHLIAIPVPPMFPPSLLALGVEAIGPHRLREMMLELLDGTDIEPVGEMLVLDGSDGLEVALDELADHLISEIMSACGDDDDDDGEEADTATGASPEAPAKSLSRDSADAVLELLKDDCSAEQFAKIQAFLQGLAD